VRSNKIVNAFFGVLPTKKDMDDPYKGIVYHPAERFGMFLSNICHDRVFFVVYINGEEGWA